jgi:predicted ferric reductase
MYSEAMGDFTSRARARARHDGVRRWPARRLSIDQDEGPGFGLIAGGVPIAGLISMLRTMADRRDVRPALLFHANREWDGNWCG